MKLRSSTFCSLGDKRSNPGTLRTLTYKEQNLDMSCTSASGIADPSREMVVLEGSVLKAWCKIGTRMALSTPNEIAEFLIKCYHNKVEAAHGVCCQLCGSPLAMTCLSCSQQLPIQHFTQGAVSQQGVSMMDVGQIQVKTESPDLQDHELPVTTGPDKKEEEESTDQPQTRGTGSPRKKRAKRAHDRGPDDLSEKAAWELLQLKQAKRSCRKKKLNEQQEHKQPNKKSRKQRVASAVYDEVDKRRANIDKQHPNTATSYETEDENSIAHASIEPKLVVEAYSEFPANSDNINEADNDYDSICSPTSLHISLTSVNGIPDTSKIEEKVFPAIFWQTDHGSDNLRHNTFQLKEASVQPGHMCNACGKGFSTIQNLSQHKRTHSALREHVCSLCSMRFKTAGTLRKHEQTHSGKRYACDCCQKHYSSFYYLKIHRRLHAPDGQAFVCEVCGRRFHALAILQKHKLTHVDLKPHVCEVCSLAFATLSILKSHKKIHSGQRAHVCDDCGSAFKRGTHLRRHKLSHTGDKPYVCEFCKKGFTRSISLEHHRLLHTGLKPYVCEVCGKAYPCFKSLKMHGLRHRELRPFVCPVCKVGFYQACHLKRHSLTHMEGKRSKMKPAASGRKPLAEKGDLENGIQAQTT